MSWGVPAPLSLDLRLRIAEAIQRDQEDGVGIAARFDVSTPTVSRLRAKLERGETLEPKLPPGPTPKLEDRHFDWMRSQLKADPFLTSYDLADRFNRHFRAVQVHRSTILRAMHSLGFSFKKNSLRPATRPT